jgi:type II secretory pathway component PulF
MSRISTKTLIQLCRRVGTSMRAGVEPRRLWETEARHATGALKRAIERVKDGVLRGESVADPMRACEGYFPPLVTEMVDVGEKTGNVDAVLFRLADHYEHQSQLTRGFLFGIAWPALQLAMGIFVIGVLILILGALDARSIGSGEPIDVLGIGLRGVSGAIAFWMICGLLIGSLTLGVLAVVRGWLGPTPMALAMRVPMLGTALANLALARLTWSLAMALDAGIDARRSMELAVRATQNPLFMSREEVLTSAIARNRQFHEAFEEAGCFPAEFLQMMETAEISGTTSESMQALCKEYEERARSGLRWLTWLTGIGIWMFIGAVLIVVIFRLFMVLYLGPINDALEMTKHPGRI